MSTSDLLEIRLAIIKIRLLELNAELTVINNQSTHPDFIYRSDVLNQKITVLETEQKEVLEGLRFFNRM